MCKLHIAIWGSLAVLAAACSNNRPGSSQSNATRPTGYGRVQTSDRGPTSLAAREVVRRQEQVRRADRAALEANRASAEGDHEAAVHSYRRALDALPSEE